MFRKRGVKEIIMECYSRFLVYDSGINLFKFVLTLVRIFIDDLIGRWAIKNFVIG